MDDDKRAKKYNDSRELELLSLRNIMKTQNGRDFMYRCLQNCCTFGSEFSTNTQQHAFNAGVRSHGLWLDTELKQAATDDYFKMLREHCNE